MMNLHGKEITYAKFGQKKAKVTFTFANAKFLYYSEPVQFPT